MQKKVGKKYIRAKIREKRIKVSYFLTPMGFLDAFNLLGTVYAQSGGGGATSNTAGGSTGGVGTGSSTGGTSGTNSGTGGN